jgi:hypothetical protein
MTFKQELKQLLEKHLGADARPRDWMRVAGDLYDASYEVDDEADRTFTREQWEEDLEDLEIRARP